MGFSIPKGVPGCAVFLCVVRGGFFLFPSPPLPPFLALPLSDLMTGSKERGGVGGGGGMGRWGGEACRAEAALTSTYPFGACLGEE